MSSAAEVEFTDDITALYRLYDTNDLLLYIGLTQQSLPRRMRQHAKEQSWWPEVARRTVVWCPTRREAARAETLAIAAESPKYNKKPGGAASLEMLWSHRRDCGYESHHDLLARWDASRFVEWGPGEWRRKLTAEHPTAGHYRDVPLPLPPDGYNLTTSHCIKGIETASWDAEWPPRSNPPKLWAGRNGFYYR